MKKRFKFKSKFMMGAPPSDSPVPSTSATDEQMGDVQLLFDEVTRSTLNIRKIGKDWASRVPQMPANIGLIEVVTRFKSPVGPVKASK